MTLKYVFYFYFISQHALVWAKTNKYTRSADSYINSNAKSPYFNYLREPRLHFQGRFKADVSTINNNDRNFDTENFVDSDPVLLSWNPRGTGEWSLHDTKVTRICYYNGSCAVSHYEDPAVTAHVLDGGSKASAKMVDLDTHAQLYSEIWGWRIHVGDYFSADFTPSPIQYPWRKMSGVIGLDRSMGVTYQSELTNIKWYKAKEESPFIGELRNIMENDENIDSKRLSIRFNVDTFGRLLYGNIAGSIGLMGIKSPTYNSHCRYVKTLSDLQDTPFIVDETKRKVRFDFGNSLRINKKGKLNMKKRILYVVVNLDKKPVTCKSSVFWLGRVRYDTPDWYRHSTGIQYYPEMGVLSDEEMELAADHPLAVMEVTGIWPNIYCKKVLMAEPDHGIGIHPYTTWVARKNPLDVHEFRVFATRFGVPLRNTQVYFELTPKKVYKFHTGAPPMPYTTSAKTNNDGIATLKIWTRDPGNPRQHVDGQLYQYLYYVDGLKPNLPHPMSVSYDARFLAMRVFDLYNAHSPPTWLDDIYPIFLQYANLYPVMKDFVDLGNYYDVVKKRKMILMSMLLPISNPNYMPVTRDLSDSKRKAIVEWLSHERPLIGRSRDFCTLENLKKNLQTALQIEYSTIPPYITAMASIKHSYNNGIKNIIKTIVNQEMVHMTLVANILNAIGGTPKLYSKKFCTVYPTRLPGGVQPDLVVPIEKLSLDLVRNVFMKIEEPGLGVDKQFEFQHTFDFVKRSTMGHRRSKRDLASDAGVDDTLYPCLSSTIKRMFDKDLSEVPSSEYSPSDLLKDEMKRNRRPFPTSDKDLTKRHNTIGGFYHHILNTLGYLTQCGTNNSIFTGDPSRQVDYIHGSMHGKSLQVTDFLSAVRAIETIVEQGEGSSLCNPMSWSNGSVSDLSHYYLFYSIVEKRQISVEDGEEICEPEGEEEFSKVCGGKYSFKGPKILFDPSGVWPMVPNPKMSKYKKGSEAYLRAHEFNKAHTRLLKSLDHLFNGNPDSLNDSLGLMYSLLIHLKKVIRTPIHPDGDPDIGPNAGPTFDFTP